jgi:hypothetical protein
VEKEIRLGSSGRKDGEGLLLDILIGAIGKTKKREVTDLGVLFFT